MGVMLKRLFGEGFRVFFLSAGLFAVFALGWWELILALEAMGHRAGTSFAMGATGWHAHELVFGYGAAALGGFLLTAVPNWTGAKAARHLFIGSAAGLWLLGRVAMAASGLIPPWLLAVADLAFVPILWVKIASLLVKRPKPQNVVFLAFLTLFWCANLATHLGWAGIWSEGVVAGPRAGIMALAGMILVIGGRVAPAFTRNAMHREGVDETDLPRDHAAFTPVMIVVALLLPLVTLVAPGSTGLALLALVAGVAQLIRQMRWGAGFAARRPILASLHASAALVALGLILWGLAGFDLVQETGALHLLAIGGVGGMTLAVMSRATLGHTGRPLIASRPLVLAYVLLPSAAFLRFLAAELDALFTPLVLAAGGLWILAFALYIGALLPAFLRPRLPKEV